MRPLFALPKQNFKNLDKPGLSRIFHYSRVAGDSKKRIHLRIEQDGSGVLLINANRMYHFNPTATMMAYWLLEDQPDEKIIAKTAETFDAPRSQISKDLQDFKKSFLRIISPTDDPCPVCDLEIESFTPFSRKPSAPYRMDLALTYRCNNRCVHCYNESSRAKNELSTNQWKKTLDKVWELGIPHVVFTGGEPTLMENLVDLVAYAESLGLITGLNTNGRLLSQKEYLNTLIAAGIDHIQITLESHDAAIHDEIVASDGAWAQTVMGIRNALDSNLYVMTNTTLLKSNSSHLADTLNFLTELGLRTIGLNGLIYSGRGRSVSEIS